MIAPRENVGQRPHRVQLQQRDGQPAANDDGGFTQPWVDMPPAAFARVSPATPGLMERLVSGTTSTTATHVVTMPWRAGVTTAMRLVCEQTPTPLQIVGVLDPDERHIDLVLACAATPPEGEWSTQP